jgi:hypothetical protein
MTNNAKKVKNITFKEFPAVLPQSETRNEKSRTGTAIKTATKVVISSHKPFRLRKKYVIKMAKIKAIDE